ncbi:hypothetical protein [Nonomuraea sp. CA-141351]|uniref:hypothetical protein n=1 Tax=Nonomuraea sp. CA-141351 TaxID=3239996 RepID=UPI003D8FC11B
MLNEVSKAQAELTGGWPPALDLAPRGDPQPEVAGESAAGVAARIAERPPSRTDLADPGSRGLIARIEGLSLLEQRTDQPVLVFRSAVLAHVRDRLGQEELERARWRLIDTDAE